MVYLIKLKIYNSTAPYCRLLASLSHLCDKTGTTVDWHDSFSLRLDSPLQGLYYFKIRFPSTCVLSSDLFRQCLSPEMVREFYLKISTILYFSQESAHVSDNIGPCGNMVPVLICCQFFDKHEFWEIDTLGSQ